MGRAQEPLILSPPMLLNFHRLLFGLLILQTPWSWSAGSHFSHLCVTAQLQWKLLGYSPTIFAVATFRAVTLYSAIMKVSSWSMTMHRSIGFISTHLKPFTFNISGIEHNFLNNEDIFLFYEHVNQIQSSLLRYLGESIPNRLDV